MEIKNKDSQNRIGRRLFRQSLVIAFVLTLLLTLVQVWLNYRDVYDDVQDTLHHIEATQAGGISTALWNVSTAEIIAQNEGILHFPYINYTAVYENGRMITEAGERKSEQYLEKEISLLHTDADGIEVPIGVLTVQADLSSLNQIVLPQIWRIFFFQALDVFLVMSFLLLLIDRRVTQYLVEAANYFNNMGQKSLNTPLRLEKKPVSDEIDTLVDSINHMRVHLSNAVQKQVESEKKYTALLSNLPGMAFRSKNDVRWTLDLVSAGCRQLTGYSVEELEGDRGIGFRHLIHPADLEEVWQQVQEGLTDRRTFEATYRIQTREGSEKWVWEKGVGVYSEADELLWIEGFISDITDKKQQEREIEAIAATSYALRNAGTHMDVIEIIMQQTSELLKADGASLELVDDFDNEIVVEQARGIYQEFTGLRFAPHLGARTQLRHSGEFCINTRESAHESTIYPYGASLCKTICGVPMFTHNRHIGFLWIGWIHETSENVVRSLAAIADIAANAIYRTDLFSKAEVQLKELLGLRRIDEAINSNQELTTTLQVLLQQTLDLLQVDAANIILMDENAFTFTFEIGMGFQGDKVRQSYTPLMENCAGRMVLNRGIQKFPDIRQQKPDARCEEVMQRENFVAYFAAPLVSNNKVKGILQVFHSKPLSPDEDWLNFLGALAGQAAIAVSQASLIEDLQHSNLELQLAYDETIEGWSNALDMRDKETEGHSQRVTDMTLVMAVMLGIKGDELVYIRRGALLHDIGKMGVPDHILLKPGPLDDQEWEIMRQHPGNAFKLLSAIDYLYPALDIPYAHHEKWDGTGYPRGLKGEEIPLAARIFAVVDVWDALTSDRPYREALSVQESLAYIQQQSGKHFDPDVVNVFMQVMRDRKISAGKDNLF